jgi:2-polyprenyl-3-methyl-5-hydroxy-6-metoxy-1,4-benzoquinol methylase
MIFIGNYFMSDAATKWNEYAKDRLLERNRLTMEYHQETVSSFIEYFKKVDIESKVLDAACGGGFFLEIFRNLGFNNIHGVDLSEIFVNRAKSKNLDVVSGSIFELNYNQEFDYIICMEIFEHLESIPIDQIHHSLKENGKLFVTVPVYDSVKHKLERLTKKISKRQQAVNHDPTHIHGFSRDMLVERVTQSGNFKLLNTTHHAPL